ncbi:hypothetical protein ACL00G_27770, partial [Klebsiella pneumoniae]
RMATKGSGSSSMACGAAWLPRVRVLHPWPVERFTARHPRQEPGA